MKFIKKLFSIFRDDYPYAEFFYQNDAEKVRLALLSAKRRREEEEKNYKPETDERILKFYNETVKEFLWHYGNNYKVYNLTYKVNIPVFLNASNVTDVFRKNGFNVELKLQPFGTMDYLIFDFSETIQQ